MKQREKEFDMDTLTRPLPTLAVACSHYLRFTSLYTPGRGVAIPCDAAGKVDIDSLTQGLRVAYLVARAMIGREYAYPTVQALVR